VARRAFLLLPILLLGCKIATIRPIESDDESPGSQDFDAATYVDRLWSEDVPAVLEEAVDLEELLPAFEADAASAGETWGRRQGTGPFHVIVKGSGRITGVDTSSRSGIAEVEVDVPGGTERIRLQIGPVLRGTSIRDALPSVSFDRFVNQIEYAEVANELNARGEREVVGALNREALQGRTARFVGMATLGEPPLVVTPVRLAVEEAP
jgi:predicted lipoprotein